MSSLSVPALSSPGLWVVQLTKRTSVSASCRSWSRSSSGTWRRSAAGRTDWMHTWARYWRGWGCVLSVWASVSANVLMFMPMGVITLPVVHPRWTAKAIRCVGRPAAFAGPSLLTRERYEFYVTILVIKTKVWSERSPQIIDFIVFLSAPGFSYLLTFSFFFSPFKFEEMNSEMEESRELADNRLIELQKLQQDLQTVHQENNNMEVGLRFSHTNSNSLLQYYIIIIFYELW